MPWTKENRLTEPLSEEEVKRLEPGDVVVNPTHFVELPKGPKVKE